MNKTVLLVNGPNLNLLGQREPEIYGVATLADIERDVTDFFKKQKIGKKKETIQCLAFQSNSEGALIDWLQAHREADFLIINPGAYSHTSIALMDTLQGLKLPFVEVHISNIYKRESFRHHSYFSPLAVGCLIGLGTYGYELAAHYALKHLQDHA